MRHWKLITLALGLCALVFGSYYEQLPDWDIGISLIMGILTYLTAPWCVRVIYRMEWRMMPLAAFLAWFTIDGSYWLYNLAIGHPSFREANWPCSTALYFMMGLFWSLDGIGVRNEKSA